MSYKNRPTGGTSKDISPLIGLLGGMMGIPTGLEGGFAAAEYEPTGGVGPDPATLPPKFTPYKAKSPIFDALTGGTATRQADLGNMQAGTMSAEQAYRMQQLALQDKFATGQLYTGGNVSKDVENNRFSNQKTLAQIELENKLKVGDAGLVNLNGLPSSSINDYTSGVAPNVFRALSANSAGDANRAGLPAFQAARDKDAMARLDASTVKNIKDLTTTQRVGEQTFVPESFYNYKPSVLPGQNTEQVLTESGGFPGPNGTMIGGKQTRTERVVNVPGYNIETPDNHEATVKARIAAGARMAAASMTEQNNVGSDSSTPGRSGLLDSARREPLTLPSAKDVPPAYASQQPKAFGPQDAPDSFYSLVKDMRDKSRSGQGYTPPAYIKDVPKFANPNVDLAEQLSSKLNVRPQPLGSSSLQKEARSVVSDDIQPYIEQLSKMPPDVQREVYQKAIQEFFSKPKQSLPWLDWSLQK